MNLHACLGASCYCKPGNEQLYRWTDQDRARLDVALRELAERHETMNEKTGLIGSDSKGG